MGFSETQAPYCAGWQLGVLVVVSVFLSSGPWVLWPWLQDQMNNSAFLAFTLGCVVNPTHISKMSQYKCLRWAIKVVVFCSRKQIFFFFWHILRDGLMGWLIYFSFLYFFLFLFFFLFFGTEPNLESSGKTQSNTEKMLLSYLPVSKPLGTLSLLMAGGDWIVGSSAHCG